MQRAVEEGWTDLEGPILRHLPKAGRIEWRSPLRDDQYAEYRDAAFLRQLGLEYLANDLALFWPRGGPQWDALALTDRGQVLLVEAKAHIREFCSPPSQAGSASLSRITAALKDTGIALGAAADHLDAWGRSFYQYTNRLAHLRWLRDKGVDAKLVLVGFVNDGEMPGRTTPEAWEAAYLVADHVLGLPARHGLSRHVLHIHPDVRGR